LELCIFAPRDDAIAVEIQKIEGNSCPRRLNALIVAGRRDESLEDGCIIRLVDAWHELAIVAVFEAHGGHHVNEAAVGNDREHKVAIEHGHEVSNHIVSGGRACTVPLTIVSCLILGLIIVLVEPLEHIVRGFSESNGCDHGSKTGNNR